MLAIARALMSRPRLLLLDEPSLGLAPLIVREIFSIIRSLNAEGVTILLVEQNAHLAMQHSHRAYVLETGQLVISGPARQLLDDERVLHAYLGG
jgi:branched-chain amino acid transport system ATP-binding protein